MTLVRLFYVCRIYGCRIPRITENKTFTGEIKMKPIKKEQITALTSGRMSALGAVLLTGAIAVASTGCSTEVKADGITIESLFVTGTLDDFTSDIKVDAPEGTNEVKTTEATLPDGIGARLSAQEGGTSTEPSVSVQADTVETRPSDVRLDSEGNITREPVETQPSENVKNNTVSKASFGALKDGTVLVFDEVEEYADFRLNGDFGSIKITRDEYSNVVFNINSNEYKCDISSVRMTYAYLIRNNNKTFIYISVVRGCYVGEINVYELGEDSVRQVGVVSDVITNDYYLNNTKSFMCYEEYGKGGVIVTKRAYKVSDNGMPVHADNLCEVQTSDTVAKVDITGKVVKDGQVTSETRTIKAGETAVPVMVNEVEYIDFKDAYGNIIRADFTKALEEYYDMNDYRWVQRAVLSMIKPVNDNILTVKDIPEGTVRKLDVSRDGKEFFTGDAYTDLVVESYHRDNVRITHGDKSFEFEISHDHAGSYITSVYLLKNNGRAYIYAVSTLEDDNVSIDVYEVTEDSVSYVGVHHGFCGVESINSTKSFVCYEYDGKYGLVSLKRFYKVGENGLPVPADYTFYLSTYGSVKTSKDITGYIVRDGRVTNEQVTVKAGEQVIPDKIVAMQYLDLIDQNGNMIRLDLEELFCEYCESGNYFWMIRAISTFIEEA